MSDFTFADLNERVMGNCSLRDIRMDSPSLTPDGAVPALEACVQCKDQCFIHTDGGLLGASLPMRLKRHPYFGEQIAWGCPGCGHEVTEDRPSIALLFTQVVEIETDPLCYNCRSKQRGQ